MSVALVVGMLESALHEAEAVGRGPRRLWFISNTFAPAELDDTWPEQAADIFAAAIEREGAPSGCWLVWDVSPDGRLHLHGLVLTVRDQHGTDERWRVLARHTPIASRLGKRVQPVTGSAARWPNAKLSRNVRQIVSYCDRAKGWPRSIPKPALRHRQVSSGVFAPYLPTSTVPPMPMVASFAAVVTNPSPLGWQGRALARLHRQCATCGEALPAGSRADRLTCSGRCRYKKHEHDQANGGAA
jgi:ribosomal protein S27AE